jgi:hypothetical protein
MEVFLLLNAVEHIAEIDEQEQLMLSLADGQVRREELEAWLEKHVKPWPAPRQSGRAESGVQPRQWMECRRHRTGTDSDEIPQRRRTGLVRDNQTNLD